MDLQGGVISTIRTCECRSCVAMDSFCVLHSKCICSHIPPLEFSLKFYKHPSTYGDSIHSSGGPPCTLMSSTVW